MKALSKLVFSGTQGVRQEDSPTRERAGGFLNQWASLEGLTQPPNYGDGGALGSGRNLEQIRGNLGAAYEGRIWLTIP